MIKEHLKLLGLKVKDKASDFSGVVNSVAFDLYGCIQAEVRPFELDKDGKMQNGFWIDIRRLTPITKKPVMEVPDFEKGYVAEGKKGPANKSSKKI